MEEAKKAGIAALGQTSRLFSTGPCLALTDSKCFKEDARDDSSATASLTKNFPPNPGQFLVGLCLEIPKKKKKVSFLFLCILLYLQPLHDDAPRSVS